MPMSEAERKAWGEKMAAARAAKAASRAEPAPIAGGSSDAPVADPPAVQHPLLDAAAIDAAIRATEEPPAFDPKGVYVLVIGAKSRLKGEGGRLRPPAMYGDLVAATEEYGDPKDSVPDIFGLAGPAVTSPGDKGILVQEEADGVEELRLMVERGELVRTDSPQGIEARKHRIAADAYRGSGERIGDIRLNVVAAGGRVYGYAWGERV